MATLDDLLLHHEVSQFIYREARLQDNHEYDAWEALWTNDGVYWIPANGEGGDPEQEMSILYDNRSRISLRVRSYPDAASRSAFYERVHSGILALPGVTGVAFTDWWPLQGAPPREVGPDSEAAPRARAGMFGVSADYFTTLGIRIVDGRAFTAADRPGAPDAAVVSQTLARTLWPGRRAIGERLRIAPPPGSDEPPFSLVVVGVANDVRPEATTESPST